MKSFIMSHMPQMHVYIPTIGKVDIQEYVVSFTLFVILILLYKLVSFVIIVRLQKLSKRTSTDIDDVIINAIKGIHAWVYIVVAAYVSLQIFSLPDAFWKLFTALVYIAVAYQVIEILLQFIEYGVQRFLEKDEDEDGDGVVDGDAANAAHLIKILARIILWLLGIIFVLSNMGIEVTSLVASLGIGGIAIAFALQGVLSDLFASFSIYADKPFRIGDYVVIGNDSGVVERIGIKSTRIRTLQGEELVVSNAELTTARVQNFKKMKERRANIQFGIIYETPLEKVKNINKVIDDIFQDINGARLDRVHFTTFGDSALLFEVVFYVNSPEYVDFLDRQQQFNYKLMEKFAQMGIEFAYPTQTIYTKVG